MEVNIEDIEPKGNKKKAIKKIRRFVRISFFKDPGMLVFRNLPGGITNFLV